MALASNESAHSITELSLSPLYHYQYSSITKAIACLAKDNKEYERVSQLLLKFCLSYYEHEESLTVLQTDVTPIGKAHSPTLPDRTYVAIANNVIGGNKPVTVGYNLSCINLAAGHNWSLPLTARRVGPDQTAVDCAVDQVNELLSSCSELALKDLVINLLDCSYGTAGYLSRTYKHKKLINVTRLRAGRKVWSAAEGKESKGAPRIYGDKYYLQAESRWKTYTRKGQSYQVWQPSIFERPADERRLLEAQTKKGRALIIDLWRWNDLKIRSKNGCNMKDKSMDVIAVRVRDAQTGQAVFKREMFLGLCGQQKQRIDTPRAYGLYRRRYGIEPYFRFGKQKLFLDKFQTPDAQHLDNWFLVVQLAAWLLYVMRKEIQYAPKKWQQYNLKEKQAAQGRALSMSQCRKGAEKLFLTFDPNPFKPLKSKKGKGRQKGQTQKQRTRYKVVKKTEKKTKIKIKTEKLE